MTGPGNIYLSDVGSWHDIYSYTAVQLVVVCSWRERKEDSAV